MQWRRLFGIRAFVSGMRSSEPTPMSTLEQWRSVTDDIRVRAAQVEHDIGRLTGTAGGINHDQIDLLAGWSAFGRANGFCMTDACRNTVSQLEEDPLYCHKCMESQKEQGASMGKEFRIEMHCPYCRWTLFDTSMLWFEQLSKCPGCQYPLMKGIIQ